METNTPNLVVEYRAHVQLPNSTCTITAKTVEEAQEHITSLLAGKCVFQEVKDGSVLIYHRAFFDGKEPIGWIARLNVPESMSLRARTDIRQKVAA